jgi:hypothetical protein
MYSVKILGENHTESLKRKQNLLIVDLPKKQSPSLQFDLWLAVKQYRTTSHLVLLILL